ncbi:hypothetical protein G3N30_00750 [Microbacterium lacticum]|uniref:hypothetical protein n=1 Tax=Microbacterium lacticum TaxID=33885 RepID=UPI0018B0EC63|nr:hypothetical protein [Microbacterium lacticum]MBF9334820.1 hypothetical protein [Microbacterium lacticum]
MRKDAAALRDVFARRVGVHAMCHKGLRAQVADDDGHVCPPGIHADQNASARLELEAAGGAPLAVVARVR